MVLIASVVVPAISETTVTFWLSKELTNKDLPTFLLPTIAICGRLESTIIMIFKLSTTTKLLFTKNDLVNIASL